MQVPGAVTPYPVRLSILDERALGERIVARYGLGSVTSCRFHRRSMSDVYLVETDRGGGRYVLKVHFHGRHSHDELAEEVRLVLDLAAAGLPVVAPLADRDGRHLQTIGAPEGTRYAVLYPLIRGDDPQEANIAHSRAFGRLAGRIHVQADGLAGAYGRRHLDARYLIEEPLQILTPYLAERPGDLMYLQELGAALGDELDRLLPDRSAPAYGLCHGDLHTGNARVAPDGRIVLYDWDSCGYGWRALDIGTFIVSYDWMDCSPESRRSRAPWREAFLDGYCLERCLSSRELDAIELSYPLRHLELMGITVRYWAPYMGDHWIDNGYLDAHLSWFRSWADQYFGG